MMTRVTTLKHFILSNIAQIVLLFVKLLNRKKMQSQQLYYTLTLSIYPYLFVYPHSCTNKNRVQTYFIHIYLHTFVLSFFFVHYNIYSFYTISRELSTKVWILLELRRSYAYIRLITLTLNTSDTFNLYLLKYSVAAT